MELPRHENTSHPLYGHFTEELDKRTHNISQAKNLLWQGVSSKQVLSFLFP